MKTADFHRLLAAFFTDRLMQQLQARPHTIPSYPDTFRLLVRHARKPGGFSQPGRSRGLAAMLDIRRIFATLDGPT